MVNVSKEPSPDEAIEDLGSEITKDSVDSKVDSDDKTKGSDDKDKTKGSDDKDKTKESEVSKETSPKFKKIRLVQDESKNVEKIKGTVSKRDIKKPDMVYSKLIEHYPRRLVVQVIKSLLSDSEWDNWLRATTKVVLFQDLN